MNKFMRLALPLLVPTVLVGCGGGSGGAGTPTFGLTQNYGEATLVASTSVTPSIASGANNVTVTGFAGASLFSFAINPAPKLTNSQIFVLTNLGDLYSIQNGVTTQISGLSTGSIQDFGLAPNGQLILDTNLGQLVDGAAVSTIGTINYDGSGMKPLVTGTQFANNGISMGANGDIAYSVDLKNVLIVNSSGQVVRTIQKANAPCLSPDGSTIAYVALGPTNTVTVSPVAGTSSAGLGAGGAPSWSKDGKFVLYSGTTTNAFLRTVNPSDDVAPYFAYFQNWFQLTSASASPDGKEAVFIATTPSATSSINLSTLNGQVIGPLAGFNNLAVKVLWTPFYARKAFVGEGAMLASASGLLWGQNGGSFSSLLAFASTDPSTATITPEVSNGGAIIDHLKAQSITQIAYTNSYYGQTFTLAPNQTDAYISFDATTGQVSAVAPFVSRPGAVKPQRSVQGGNWVYQGQFSGVWNAKGINIAPRGATTLKIDRTTGRLLAAM